MIESIEREGAKVVIKINTGNEAFAELLKYQL